MKKILGILMLLIVVSCVTTIVEPQFLTPLNLENLIRRAALFGIISIGVSFVIITGGIDLSIGSVIGLVGCLLPLFLVEWGWSIPLSLSAVIAVALLIGAGWRTAAWMTGTGVVALGAAWALNLPSSATWSWDDLTAVPLAGPPGRGLVAHLQRALRRDEEPGRPRVLRHRPPGHRRGLEGRLAAPVHRQSQRRRRAAGEAPAARARRRAGGEGPGAVAAAAGVVSAVTDRRAAGRTGPDAALHFRAP